MTDPTQVTPDRIVRGLSLARRVGHTVAGLGGLLSAGLLGLLWATEPTPLPARTKAAFAALIAVGLTWAGLAAWALVRRPLFAIDRVVTATLALILSTVSAAWAAVIAWNRGDVASMITVAGVGLSLILGSSALLVRARAYRATLLDRRRRLDHDVNRDARTPLPIGPLGLALHLRSQTSTARFVTFAAVILVLAVLTGLALLVV